MAKVLGLGVPNRGFSEQGLSSGKFLDVRIRARDCTTPNRTRQVDAKDSAA